MFVVQDQISCQDPHVDQLVMSDLPAHLIDLLLITHNKDRQLSVDHKEQGVLQIPVDGVTIGTITITTTTMEVMEVQDSILATMKVSTQVMIQQSTYQHQSG